MMYVAILRPDESGLRKTNIVRRCGISKNWSGTELARLSEEFAEGGGGIGSEH